MALKLCLAAKPAPILSHTVSLRQLRCKNPARRSVEPCTPPCAEAKGGIASKRSVRPPKCSVCPSPDLADALACTFGAEIATLPQLSDWVQPGQIISDWNPFSNESIRGEPLPEAQAMHHGRYYAPPEEGWEWPRLKSDFE